MTLPPSYKDGEANVAYVYLLRSLKTTKFYIGWTVDVKRRLYQHNQGKTLSTKAYCPWELIGYESFSNNEDAKHREKILKRNKRMQFFFKKRLMAAKEVVG
jgi:putative endonuclease